MAITLNNLGILEGTPSRLEEALKIYRELAQKEREIYLPYVAITLNNLGMLDSGKNRGNEARKEYAEALKMYRDLAQKEPETYLPYVPMTLNNLGFLIMHRIGGSRLGRSRGKLGIAPVRGGVCGACHLKIATGACRRTASQAG